MSQRDIKRIKDAIGVGSNVANELMLLADDPELAIEASRASTGLDQCKARILNERFRRIEERVL